MLALWILWTWFFGKINVFQIKNYIKETHVENKVNDVEKHYMRFGKNIYASLPSLRRKYEMAKIPKSEQSRNTRLVGITSQKNKWVNIDPRTYRSRDQEEEEYASPVYRSHPRWTQFQMPVVKHTVSKLGKRNNPLSKSVCSVR